MEGLPWPKGEASTAWKAKSSELPRRLLSVQSLGSQEMASPCPLAMCALAQTMHRGGTKLVPHISWLTTSGGSPCRTTISATCSELGTSMHSAVFELIFRCSWSSLYRMHCLPVSVPVGGTGVVATATTEESLGLPVPRAAEELRQVVVVATALAAAVLECRAGPSCGLPGFLLLLLPLAPPVWMPLQQWMPRATTFVPCVSVFPRASGWSLHDAGLDESSSV